ncbi:MAG: hypothetical protein A2147_06670 [Chloroflexi bacterium RBG_16_57_8]|nr:MAG: hypothetical protein A2147_06670 [Chloroflexi bacterium RBG_16_57_8]
MVKREPCVANIREIRTRLGCSQETLAQQIGVSLSTVQRWEKQRTQPSRLARQALQRVLNRAGVREGAASDAGRM